MQQRKPSAYRRAGVDIDAGDALVERIKPFAKATRRLGSMDDLGGFGALFDPKKAGYKNPLLVAATDGVGTKLKIAQIADRHDTIGIDLVAMCVNDLVVQGAEPLFFLDYFASGKLHVDTAAKVVKGIAEGCKQAGCALIGGETAEMPGMYAPGEYDLAGFSVGAVERDRLLPSAMMKKGDVILGLASSGIHSNGYSLVRNIVAARKLDYAAAAPFGGGKTLAAALLTPTRIYVRSCLKALRKYPKDVKAMAHITGGGITENLPRVLPKGLSAHINRAAWKLPPVFAWLQKAGDISGEEMYRTFNCGIGMAMVVDRKRADKIIDKLEKYGERVYVIGELAPRKSKPVTFHG